MYHIHVLRLIRGRHFQQAEAVVRDHLALELSPAAREQALRYLWSIKKAQGLNDEADEIREVIEQVRRRLDGNTE